MFLVSGVFCGGSSREIDGINSALVEVDEKDGVVSEATDSVHGGHFDDEAEQIVDEGVDESEAKKFPGKVGDGFEGVVESELRRHQDESKGVDRRSGGGESPGVP